MISNSELKVRAILVLSFAASFQKCLGNQASGKLDFGDSSTQNPAIVNIANPQNANIKQTAAIIDNISDTSEQSQQVISCINTGCNVTNSGNDTVETIVVLQVKTKLNPNKNDNINKNYDVPVSVGYNGARLDPTFEDRSRPSIFENRRNFDTNNFHDRNFPGGFRERGNFDEHNTRYDIRYPQQHVGGDPYFRPSDIARPTYPFTSRPNHDENHSRNGFDPYNHHDISPDNHRSTPSPYGNSPLIPLGQNRPGYQPFYQSNQPRPFYHRENEYNPRNNNENPYNILRNAMNQLLNPYQHNPNSEININVKSLTPLAVTVTDKHGSNRLNENGVELRIPHFEPSANKHYFGDEAPTYSGLHKGSNVNPVAYNPVAFKTNPPSRSFNSFFDIFKPNPYENNFHKTPEVNVSPRSHRHIDPLCNKNHHNLGGNRKPNGGISFSDPGANISDKLAPLV